MKEKVKSIKIMDLSGCTVKVEATGDDTVEDLLAVLWVSPAARLNFGGMDLSKGSSLCEVGIEDGATMRLLSHTHKYLL